MADLNDVCNALVTLATQTIYPNGTGQISAILGAASCKIYQGWPIPQQLDTDLQNGLVNVSIFPSQSERNTTRYSKDWQQLSINTPTLTTTVAGQTITIGGTISSPQNVMALVDNKSFVYPVQSNDTLTSIATALAALIAAQVTGTSSAGAVITIPNGKKLQVARAGAYGKNIREIKRQERLFQITVWANTPDLRTSAASLLDAAFADISRITLADQTIARLTYKGSMMSDGNEKNRIYRRDLNYTVEYATTQTATDTAIVTIQENVSSQIDGATSAILAVQINT